jgi:hypothetical protein
MNVRPSVQFWPHQAYSGLEEGCAEVIKKSLNKSALSKGHLCRFLSRLKYLWFSAANRAGRMIFSTRAGDRARESLRCFFRVGFAEAGAMPLPRVPDLQSLSKQETTQ